MAAPERLLRLSASRYGVAFGAAVTLFILAYDNGAYALTSQATAAIVVWWAIMLAGLAGLVEIESLSPASRWVASALAGLTAWTFVSTYWSSSAEVSIAELDRMLLYLGLFLLVALLVRPGMIDNWANGLACGISAVAVVALASRFFPSLFSERGLATFLPAAQTRLSFPLGYWNGLAIFCALAVPLLLRISLVAQEPLLRGVALAPLPANAAVIFLASSRGGVAALAIGTVVFVVASPRRWALVATVAVAAGGSAAAIAVLLARPELANGPLAGHTARSEGRSAAWLIVLVCLVTAACFALVCRRWPAPLVPSEGFGRGVVIALLFLMLVGVAVAHPIRRFDAFKASPEAYHLSGSGGFVRAHLLSGNGSGRWQFWASAIDEWRTAPWIGRGAGSFEAWWAAHGTLGVFVKDAHSLYLETLGELGIIGLALLLAALVGGIVAGVARIKRTTGNVRITTASLLAVLIAYVVAAAIDWIWELTVVSIVAVVCLALLVQTPIPRSARGRATTRSPIRRRRSAALGLVSVVAALAILIEVDQLLSQTAIRNSQAAAAHHQLSHAFQDAVDARNLQPWAATPYLQAALVSELQGRLVTASDAIDKATVRAPDDWRLWLVRARIETKRGLIQAAVKSLHRAQELNPRSPLFVQSH
jgi:O-antigen ligase